MLHPSKGFVKKLLWGLALFCILTAAGVSFNRQRIELFWSRWPVVAIVLVLLGLLLFRYWYQLMQEENKMQLNNLLSARQDREEAEKRVHSLSPREREVLQKMSEGKSNKEITGDLFVESSTVKSHINHIYKVLGVKNRKEAILTYLKSQKEGG